MMMGKKETWASVFLLHVNCTKGLKYFKVFKEKVIIEVWDD